MSAADKSAAVRRGWDETPFESPQSEVRSLSVSNRVIFFSLWFSEKTSHRHHPLQIVILPVIFFSWLIPLASTSTISDNSVESGHCPFPWFDLDRSGILFQSYVIWNSFDTWILSDILKILCLTLVWIKNFFQTVNTYWTLFLSRKNWRKHQRQNTSFLSSEKWSIQFVWNLNDDGPKLI